MGRAHFSIAQYIQAGLAATAPPPSNICGDVMRQAATSLVTAVDVYNCYTSVPFNGDVANRLVDYWNDTLQFQSTLEYLKQPPSSYQKLPIDLNQVFGEILALIADGGYTNQYQFETDFQTALRSAGDAHLSFDGGLMSAFGFGSPYGITSVSIDGIQLPEAYFTDDLKLNQTHPSPDWKPSPMKEINGLAAVDYLATYAVFNSPGTLDYDADWNLLFDSPVNDILPTSSPLWVGGAAFFPDEYLNITFANGTTFSEKWLAVYEGPLKTGPLETGGDFYNFFVLGLYPAACNSSSPPTTCPFTDMDDTPSSEDAVESSSSSHSPPRLGEAFPSPDVFSPTLGLPVPITGYFLHESSLAVLSLPTFYAFGNGIQGYVDTVRDFLRQARSLGLKRVLVDLQQNEGGDTLLAYMVFRQFFPSIEPFAGSKGRAQSLGDFMGNWTTPYWQQTQSAHPDIYAQGSANEWVATIRLNATSGSNFSSWQELYGPYWDGVDSFTAVEQLNITNEDFVRAAFGNPKGLPDLMEIFDGNDGYTADDIVMLSDGLCSSACSLFMEMMHQDAGVPNVVMGGYPETGPMQTPAGSRGAQEYSLKQLDTDIFAAAEIAQNANQPVPDIVLRRGLNSVFYTEGGVTIRSQIRQGQTAPLEMQYEAADCRLWYTPDTFNNFTRLWSRAATAWWDDQNLCVADSTGWQDVTFGNSTKKLPPAKPPQGINYTHGVPASIFPGGLPLSTTDQPIYDGPISFIVGERPLFSTGPTSLSTNDVQHVIPDLWPHLSSDQSTKVSSQWNTLPPRDQSNLVQTKQARGWSDRQMVRNINQLSTANGGRVSYQPWGGGGNGAPAKRRRSPVKTS